MAWGAAATSNGSGVTSPPVIGSTNAESPTMKSTDMVVPEGGAVTEKATRSPGFTAKGPAPDTSSFTVMIHPAPGSVNMSGPVKSLRIYDPKVSVAPGQPSCPANPWTPGIPSLASPSAAPLPLDPPPGIPEMSAPWSASVPTIIDVAWQ